jgi:NAD(P)-dependent dehydrogenase (short-subunit alcohol dehydrogenase family)
VSTLDGKVALVTGASRRIGAGIAAAWIAGIILDVAGGAVMV